MLNTPASTTSINFFPESTNLEFGTPVQAQEQDGYAIDPDSVLPPPTEFPVAPRPTKDYGGATVATRNRSAKQGYYNRNEDYRSPKKPHLQSHGVVLPSMSDLSAQNVLPTNLEAEEVLIGSILRDKEVYPMLLDKIKLVSAWFYFAQTRVLCYAYERLYARDAKIDPIVFKQEIKDIANGVDCENAPDMPDYAKDITTAYIASLMNRANPMIALDHATLVKQSCFQRQILTFSMSLFKLGLNNEKPSQTIIKMQAGLDSLTEFWLDNQEETAVMRQEAVADFTYKATQEIEKQEQERLKQIAEHGYARSDTILTGFAALDGFNLLSVGQKALERGGYHNLVIADELGEIQQGFLLSHRKEDKENGTITATLPERKKYIENDIGVHAERGQYVDWDGQPRVLLEKGNMSAIIAGSSRGKSSLLHQIIKNGAKYRGLNSLNFRVELTPIQQIHRDISRDLRIEYSRLHSNNLTPYEMSQKIAWLAERSSWPGRADEVYCPGWSMEQICRKATMMHNNRIRATGRGYDVITVDYLLRIAPPRGWEDNPIDARALERSIRQLGELANKLGVHCILLNQMNREGIKESRLNERPRMEHAFGAGALEQYCNVVLALHEPVNPRNAGTTFEKNGTATKGSRLTDRYTDSEGNGQPQYQRPQLWVLKMSNGERDFYIEVVPTKFFTFMESSKRLS
jgi:replicative DNA helicase